MSNNSCEKNPNALMCNCPVPCGAICSVEGCRNSAEVLIEGRRVFGDALHMIKTTSSTVGDVDGVIDTSSPDVWAWVCSEHS